MLLRSAGSWLPAPLFLHQSACPFPSGFSSLRPLPRGPLIFSFPCLGNTNSLATPDPSRALGTMHLRLHLLSGCNY